MRRGSHVCLCNLIWQPLRNGNTNFPLDNLDSGKRHAKCVGKRVVAGKVIKESYGKEKQQHTFTVRFDATVLY